MLDLGDPAWGSHVGPLRKLQPGDPISAYLGFSFWALEAPTWGVLRWTLSAPDWEVEFWILGITTWGPARSYFGP